MPFQILLSRRIVDSRRQESVGQSLAPQGLKDVFGLPESVNHHNHMAVLAGNLISLNIINKSFPAILKASLKTADIPVVKQTAFLGKGVALDTPFLIKEQIFPKMTAAQSVKIVFHV